MVRSEADTPITLEYSIPPQPVKQARAGKISIISSHSIKEKRVSILTVFTLPTMNAEKYNRAIKELEAAGQGKPKGRLYHFASRQEECGSDAR